MMKRAPTFSLGLVLGALTFAVTAPNAGAQVATSASDRGWVGVSLSFSTTMSVLGTTTRVEVTDVKEGSPAHAAGVRPGDLLLSVDGHGADDQFGGVLGTLRSGDRVTLAIEREGKRREMQMTAVSRPQELAEGPPPHWTFSVGSDSMADVVFRAMDSLRLQLVQGQDGLVRVFTVPGAEEVPTSQRSPAAGQIRLRNVGDATGVFGPPRSGEVTVQILPEVRPPFSFFLFPGDRTDSLLEEMDQVNRQIRGLRARQTQRSRHLEALRQSVDGDAEFQRLSHELDDAGRRADQLRSAMARVAREEAQGRYGVISPATPEEASRQSALRPLAPYLLGQNRAAGAQVVGLAPELAEYFHVDGGVLVVDVPEGTPAAEAGVLPGDVITAVDNAAVNSIEQLRLGLSRPGGEPLRLTLVRKGGIVEVTLRRSVPRR